MIAIDTNVLVRVLVDEPGQPVQVTAARALVSDAGEVFVLLVVLVETVWVLESAYGLPKSDVLHTLEPSSPTLPSPWTRNRCAIPPCGCSANPTPTSRTA